MAMATMPQRIPFTDATPLLADPPRLRALAAQDGALCLRGLLPAADVLAVRAMVLHACSAEGWLDPTRAVEDGVVRPGAPQISEAADPATWQPFYHRLYQQRELHALNHHPRLLAATSALLDGAVLPHPRVIGRVVSPGTARWTTPPHQDVFYIGGTPDTWTAWVPLGDCPVALGALAVALGSHRQGRLPVHRAEGAGGHGVGTAADWRWAVDDLRAGDVLLFHSHTVHQGQDNRSGDRLRLSCDLRYQRQDEAVRQDSLEPHLGPGFITWDEVHARWPAGDPLRGYWRDLPLTVVTG